MYLQMDFENHQTLALTHLAAMHSLCPFQACIKLPFTMPCYTSLSTSNESEMLAV
jgi:hypothetical protein